MKENDNVEKALVAIMCGVGINLCVYYFFFRQNFVIRACLLGILIQILFWVASSWLENLVYLIYMKMNRYKMQSICIYPLEIYPGGGVGINCSLINLLDIASSAKIEDIVKKNKEKDFFDCYRRIVKYFFVGNIALILGSIVLAWKSQLLGFVSFMLWVQKLVVESMEPDKLFVGGRYAKHTEMPYYLISTRIAVEEYNKTDTYRYLLERIRIAEKNMNVRQYDLLEECLLDSLLDHKKYLTKEIQKDLYDVLYEHQMPIYQRMAFLLMAYGKMFGTEGRWAERNLYRRYVDDGLLCKNPKYREKIVRYQKNDFRIWSDVRNGNRKYRDRVRILAEGETTKT